MHVQMTIGMYMQWFSGNALVYTCTCVHAAISHHVHDVHVHDVKKSKTVHVQNQYHYSFCRVRDYNTLIPKGWCTLSCMQPLFLYMYVHDFGLKVTLKISLL